MTLFRRFLARLLGVTLCLFAIATGPAAAFDKHTVSHWTSAVETTHHHHHTNDGKVVSDHDHGHAPESQDDETGHAHLPPAFVGFEVPGVAAMPLVFIVYGPARNPISSEIAPPDRALPPQDRPPRTV